MGRECQGLVVAHIFLLGAFLSPENIYHSESPRVRNHSGSVMCTSVHIALLLHQRTGGVLATVYQYAVPYLKQQAQNVAGLTPKAFVSYFSLSLSISLDAMQCNALLLNYV